jgi:thioredoxin 1
MQVRELIREVTEASFDQVVLQSEMPVLVDFWAPWCAPCRALAPVVNAIAEKLSTSARVVKINVDDSPVVAGRYGIRGIPTLILFKDGKEVERLVGATNEQNISRRIDQHLNATFN